MAGLHKLWLHMHAIVVMITESNDAERTRDLVEAVLEVEDFRLLHERNGGREF